MKSFKLISFTRIFVMIENSAQDNIHGDQTKLNSEQTIMEIGLASSFASVLQQCSTPIYMVGLSVEKTRSLRNDNIKTVCFSCPLIYLL